MKPKAEWATDSEAIRTRGIIVIIIYQTHYEKSDWSRAFNQFTIACELDMMNAISAADIAFIMSSSTSAKPLGVFSSETEWLNRDFKLMFLKIFL